MAGVGIHAGRCGVPAGMELETSRPERQAGGEGCPVVAVRLPVRIVVLVLVLVLVVPARMVWDALVVAGRFLAGTMFRPAGRALLWRGRAVFVWPSVGLWRYVLVPLGGAVTWLGRVLVVLLALAVHRWVLTPLGHALTAVGTGILSGLVWLGRHLVVVPSAWVYRWILTPVGHVLAWCGGGLLWCGTGLVRLLTALVTGIGTGLYRTARILLVLPALAVWRRVLAPAGRVLGVVAREAGAALGHAWRVAGYVSLAVGRALGTLLRWILVEPVRWVYRSVLTPVGHAVRDAVLRPAVEAARAVGRAGREALAAARASVRRARADVRRTLFGAPLKPQAAHRREPPGAEARTLGSSTTALTKD